MRRASSSEDLARFPGHSKWALVFLVLLNGLSHTVWGFERDKTDLVTLRNGNNISGNIISLRFGILRVKTSDMSTLNIKWPAVRSILSKFSFAVEIRDGTKIFGPIDTSSDGTQLIVGGGDRLSKIRMEDVERIDKYSPSFWRRINGNLAVGFSYTKSSAISIGSVNLDSAYRSTATDIALAFSSNSTKSTDGVTTNRDVLSTSVQFLQQSRNFWGLIGSAERDQDLGIDTRLVGGAVLGRRLAQTSHSELTGTVGLVGSQEWIAGSSAARTSVEGVIGGAWRVFKFTDPETTLNLDMAVFPSISESGRYRATGDLSLTYKVTGDFTVGLAGYLSYDNRPPEPTAQTSDYGLTFNLGYSFGR
jgi:Protein of unknown function, DUF481